MSSGLTLGAYVRVHSAGAFGHVLGFSGRDVKVHLDGRACPAWWDMADLEVVA